MTRTKAVHFMKEKGFLEVKGKDTRWTDSKILVLHCPEDMSIGKDKCGCEIYLKPGRYTYENKSFLSTQKDRHFPNLDYPVKNCDKRQFSRAKEAKEHNCLKLLRINEHKEEYAIELTNHKSKVFINYDYYKYLTDERHCWRVNEFRIKGRKDPVLGYCDGMLLGMIMPIDLEGS